MAARHRIAVVCSVYLLFFAVALRLFLLGHHILALLIVFGIWAVLAAWLRLGR